MQLYIDKVVLMAFGTAGIRGIESLFSLGLQPNNLALLTYRPCERNKPLWDFATAHRLELAGFHVRSDEARNWMQKKKPDVVFSLHYRDRIPQHILDIPRFGCVNMHPSLLPDYRGCFSAPWAIINGETVTGYTYHFMELEFDTGNIILQERIPISPLDTAFSLFHKLLVKSMESFADAFHSAVMERKPGYPQPKGGSYYPRRVPYDGKIDTSWSDDLIERFIRAMYFPPFKGAVLSVNGEEYEIKSMDEYRRIRSKDREG